MRADTEQCLRLLRMGERKSVKGWKRLLPGLESELVPGEDVIGIVPAGRNQYGNGVAMLTQNRLLVGEPGGATEIMLYDIAGVALDREGGQWFWLLHHRTLGEIILHHGDIQVTDLIPPSKGFRQFANALIELVQAAVPPPDVEAGPITTLAEELQKLADLVERGFLSREEFELQKKQLLSG